MTAPALSDIAFWTLDVLSSEVTPFAAVYRDLLTKPETETPPVPELAVLLEELRGQGLVFAEWRDGGGATVPLDGVDVESLLESHGELNEETVERWDFDRATIFFGLTEAGGDAWVREGELRGAEPPRDEDWFVITYDAERCAGEVLAKTSEICFDALKEFHEMNPRRAMLEESYRVESIPEFKPKYFKRIENAVRVSFRWDEAES